MKTTVLIALATVAVAASPALAQKKKSKGKHKTVAAVKDTTKESRRLCDELSTGVMLAKSTGDAKPKKVVADDAAAMAAANAFDVDRLGDRKNTLPSGDAMSIKMEAQTLTTAQIGSVVKGHGDLAYCWDRLPPAQRTSSALSLHLTIEARGNVSAMTIGGDAPKAFATCITAASKRWQFPIADTQTVADYPIVLN